MPRFHDDDSSSSDHNSDGVRRSSRRDRVKYGSQCGIRSVNEYQDLILKKDKKTAKSYVEKGDESKAWAGARATDHDNDHYSSEAGAGAALLTDGNHSAYKATANASAEYGVGGAIADAGVDATVYSYGDDIGQLDVGKGYLGGGLGAGAGGVKAVAEAGVDLVDVNVKFSERQSMDVNVGLNAKTGVEAGVDGVSFSLLGFGASAGRNTGISTPFGGIKFKLW